MHANFVFDQNSYVPRDTPLPLKYNAREFI